MYAMLATSLGFAAMFISTVPMIQSFGLVAMIGIMSLLLYFARGHTGRRTGHPLQAKTAGPAGMLCGRGRCLQYLRHQKKFVVLWPVPYQHLGKNSQNPVPILLIAALIAVIGFQIDPLIPIEANENNFVPSDMPARSRWTRSHGSWGEPAPPTSTSRAAGSQTSIRYNG